MNQEMRSLDQQRGAVFIDTVTDLTSIIKNGLYNYNAVYPGELILTTNNVETVCGRIITGISQTLINRACHWSADTDINLSTIFEGVYCAGTLDLVDLTYDKVAVDPQILNLPSLEIAYARIHRKYYMLASFTMWLVGELLEARIAAIVGNNRWGVWNAEYLFGSLRITYEGDYRIIKYHEQHGNGEKVSSLCRANPTDSIFD